MRIIIDLTDTQVTRLEQVVRRAIDVAYPGDSRQTSLQEIRRRAFGLWRRRNVDAVEDVDALRDEWKR